MTRYKDQFDAKENEEMNQEICLDYVDFLEPVDKQIDDQLHPNDEDEIEIHGTRQCVTFVLKSFPLLTI